MTSRKAQGKPVEPWEDRLLDAVYQSPSGTRIPLTYESVSRDITRRIAVFEFNGLNEAYLQDNGYGSRSYPMRCFFTGPNHDRQATRFESALIEKGIGQLDHPMYGVLNVIPTGTISRRNDLVAEANQSVIEVTFSTTLASVYPSGRPNNQTEIDRSLDSFGVGAAADFANNPELQTVKGQASARSGVVQSINIASEKLGTVTGALTEAKREFDAVVRNINEGIDQFIGAPLALANQIVQLIQAPARALAGIRSRLAGYLSFLEAMFDFNRSTGGSFTDFRVADLHILSAVSGSVLSSFENYDFQSRQEAFEVALKLGEQFDLTTAWREELIQTSGFFDTGETWRQLQNAVAIEQGRLVQLAFDLRTERSEVLIRARTPLDLCGKYYQAVDDETLNFFLSTNRITGTANLLIPKGQRVIWYA